MAVRQVIVSDISGTDIPDDAHARIVITDHPALRGSPVELDVTAEEAERFQTSKIDLVTMEIHAPGQSRRHVALEASALHSLFPDADLGALIDRARPVAGSSPPAARRGGRGGGRRAKVDYSSGDHAGSLHRGRVTESEAAYVRSNLEAVNVRLAANGERTIDPADAKEKSRYGF